MGVLQDFERRLEGAVEGFFARTLRSGLQPVELAKGLQRYARDTRQVTHDGVVVPNVYRFHVNPADLQRFERLGADLAEELAAVVTATALEEDWLLRGNVAVLIEPDQDVRVGRYELTARVESTGRRPVPSARSQIPAQAGPGTSDDPDGVTNDEPSDEPVGAPASTPGHGSAPHATQLLGATAPGPSSPRAALRVVDGGSPTVVRLQGRTVAGRGSSCAVRLDDSTVSREHAAFVRRDGTWWVVDLGSTNGTAVNQRTAAEHALSDGDRVRLGDAVLEFVEA